MSMQVTRIYTHWTPNDAHAVIEFLDILRDQLWEQYGDQIIDSLVTDAHGNHATDQLSLPGFDDEF